MDIVQFALDVIQKAGPIGCLVLFAWLLMSGRVVTASELKRAEDGHEREKQQLRDTLKVREGELSEWKFMAVRGTELAQFFGEKVATPR